MKPTYTSNVPAARNELLKIADELRAEGQEAHAVEIERVVAERLFRRHGSRRAPATRTRVTPQIEAQVLDRLLNTNLSQEEIGREFNIDGGRVSEISQRMRN